MVLAIKTFDGMEPVDMLGREGNSELHIKKGHTRQNNALIDDLLTFEDTNSLYSEVELNVPVDASLYRLFKNNKAIYKLPDLDLRRAGYVSEMYSDCTNLETVGNIRVDYASAAQGMFSNCSALTSVRGVSLTLADDISNMFRRCGSLQSLHLTRLHNVKNTQNLLLGTSSLSDVTLDGLGAAPSRKAVLDISGTGLDAKGADTLINSLAASNKDSPWQLTYDKSLSIDTKQLEDKGWTANPI